MNADGSYTSREMPGPGNFMQWTAAWRVFAVAMVMLGQATLQALEEYFRNMERLNMLYPDAWHLVYTADDRCRSSHLSRVKRKCLANIKEGSTPPPGCPSPPWHG